MYIGEKMSQSNIDLIRFLYDAFDRRNEAAVVAAMDPEVEFRQSEHLPWGGYYKASPTVSTNFSANCLLVSSRK
jgi:ketosteroid isomerase-like protein